MQKFTHSAHIYRQQSTSDGTFGRFVTSTGLHLLSGELAWNNNALGASCVPTGSYSVAWALSPKFGWVYKLANAPNRSGILIHPANDLPKELRGCIALGCGAIDYRSKRLLFQSRRAIMLLSQTFNRQPFTLTITNE